MKTPSIVTGNDFVMKVYVYQPRYIDNNTVMEEFSLRDCSSIKVFLINNADSYCVEYTLDENEDNLLKVVVDFKLPIGSYGLEITGKDSQGKNWRFKAKKGEMFNIIDATSGSDFNNDLLEDGLYVTAQVGILGIDVDDFVTKADLELLSISWNDLTDKPTIPTNMSQLNNDAGYVNDLSNYYTKREVDERDRYETSPMSVIFSDTQYFLVWNTDTIFVHNYNSVEGATLTINANLTGTDTVIINWQYKIVVTVNHHCTYEWITDDVVKLMFDESFTSLDIHNTNGYTFEIYADQGITIREKLQNVETQLNENYYTKSNIDSLINNSDIIRRTEFEEATTIYDNSSYSYSPSTQQTFNYYSLNGYYNYYDAVQTIDITRTYAYTPSQGSTYITQFTTEYSISPYSYPSGININWNAPIPESNVQIMFDFGTSRGYLTLDFYGQMQEYHEYEYSMGEQGAELTPPTHYFDYVNGGYFNGNYQYHLNLSLWPDIQNTVIMANGNTIDLYDAGTYDSSPHYIHFESYNSDNVGDGISLDIDFDNYVVNLISGIYPTYTFYGTSSVNIVLPHTFTSWNIDTNSNTVDISGQGDSSVPVNPSGNNRRIKDVVIDIMNDLAYNYPTNSDIANAGYITSGSIDNFVTKDEINNAGYLTSHQSLDNYVTKDDINNASYLTEHQDLSSYVTYDYLSSQSYLTEHQSLDNYVTKTDIENASYVTSDYLSQQSYLTEHQSLNDYVTKSDLDNASYLTEHQDLSSYVTYDYLSAQSYLTQHQSLDNYVTKSDLDNASYLTEHQDLSSYVTYDFLSSQAYLQQHQDLSSYVTYDYLSAQSYLTQHQSLNGYATESWVNDKFEDILGVDADGISGIKEILEDNDTYTGILKEIVKKANAEDVYTKSDIVNASYVTSDYLSQQSYLTQHQSLDNYVTYDFLSSQSYLTEHQDLSAYVTKEDLNNASYLTEHQDLSSYVTYDYLSSQSYLTQHQSLDNYVTKSDIENASYITSDYLSQQSYLTQHQSLDNYVTKSDLDNASYLTEHQDLSSYVTYDYLSAQSYLTQHQSLDNYVTKSDIENASYITSDYLSQQSYLTQHQSLDNYVTKEDLNNASYLTEHQDLSSYVTYDYLSTQSYLTQHQSLDNYVTKSDIDNASYVTQTSLSNMGYLTSHQSLSDYVSKSDLNNAGYLTSHQSLDDYVTKTDLSNASYLTEHQDLSSYVTYEYLSAQSYLTEHQDLSSYVTYDYLSSQSYLTQHQSLDNYYTKSDIQGMSYVSQSELSSMGYLQSHQLLSNYYTKTEINNAGYLTSHQSLSNYVTTTQLDERTLFERTNYSINVTNYGEYILPYKVTELIVQISEQTSFESIDIYTEDLNSVSIPFTQYETYPLTSTFEGLSVVTSDLGNGEYKIESNQEIVKFYRPSSTPIKVTIAKPETTVKENFNYYVSKTDLDNASYITKQQLSNCGYLTSHQSLSNYYTKTQINNMSYVSKSVLSSCSYVTQTSLSNMGYLQSHQSLSNYYTKTEINNAGYLTSHQSLSNYPTKTDISNASYVTQTSLSNMGYLTSHQSLTDYVTKSDIDNASYVTQTSLSNMGYLTSHQSLTDYVSKTELSNCGYLTSHQSLSNYPTKTDISNASYVTQTSLSNASYATQNDVSTYFVSKNSLNQASYVSSSTSGLRIEVVASLPANPDNNCIYIIQ